MSQDRTYVPPIYPPDLHAGCRVALKSDVGTGREENQDYMGYMRAPGQQLVVVADGMGGHSGGFEASRIAVQAVQEVFGKSGALRPPPEVLHQAVAEAHRMVKHVSVKNPDMAGMGTTIVMGLVRDHQLWVAHVGDSRCYHIRGDTVTLLTLDHSRINRMIEAGMVTPEAAVNHPMGHILESCVGGSDVPTTSVSLAPIALAKGDRLLLCSDGYWGSVTENEMVSVNSGRSLLESVEGGIERALLNLTDDNTTIGMLEVVEGPDQAPRPVDVRAAMGAAPKLPHPPTAPGAPPREPPVVAASAAARLISHWPWIVGIGLAMLMGLVLGGAVVMWVVSDDDEGPAEEQKRRPTPVKEAPATKTQPAATEEKEVVKPKSSSGRRTTRTRPVRAADPSPTAKQSSQPEVTEPEVTQPEVTQPEVTQPASTSLTVETPVGEMTGTVSPLPADTSSKNEKNKNKNKNKKDKDKDKDNGK